MIYAHPNTAGAPVEFKRQYDNFIGGKFVKPADGQYFDVITPISGKVHTQAARSNERDVELALDAAHAAAAKWAATSPAERANVLLKIADRIEQNLERWPTPRRWTTAKPMRETLNADIPLAVDHFRCAAGCLRAGRRDQRDRRQHHRLPLPRAARRGRPDHPWNFPILMARGSWRRRWARATAWC